MAKVRLVARSARGRIRDASPRPGPVDEVAFRSVFPDARPLGLLPGDGSDPLSLVQIGQTLERTLRSTGGRPALAGADETPMRVSLILGDRRKVEAITAEIARHARLRPSSSQMVAVLCHLALAHIPEPEITASMERLLNQAGDSR